MKAGVKSTVVFVLFLTDGALTRPFVQLELRTAIAERKPILLVHETDERHGAPLAGFGAYIEQTPEDLRTVLFNGHESIPFRRRGYEAESMYEQMMRRLHSAGLAQTSSA